MNRIDSSLIERKLLDELVFAFSKPGHVLVIDSKGQETELPEPLYRHLMHIVQLMVEGRAVVMLPEDETFTTQAAADFLGMSRQFFVNLLENKEMPCHYVGSHRRVYFKDLLEYQRKRDKKRSKVLDRLFDEIDKAGLYEPEH